MQSRNPIVHKVMHILNDIFRFPPKKRKKKRLRPLPEPPYRHTFLFIGRFVRRNRNDGCQKPAPESLCLRFPDPD